MQKSHVNKKGLNTICYAMKESYGALPALDHLVRVNRASNQAFFLEGFSHKCNNQINSVLLGGELLQNSVQEIERLFNLLESEPEHLPEIRDTVLATMPTVIHGINTSARKLTRFVSHLSAFTANGTLAESRDVDFNHLAALCVSIAEHQIHTFTDHFQLNLGTNIPTLAGNAQQMLQVILNLLMNSLLSLPDRSCEVVLSTSCNHDTGQVQLCIRDAGTGISQDTLPHISEPYFTTWSKRGCMGLGLTVADRIVHSHGGVLSIDSAPDKGTSALVSLPAHKSTTAPKREHNHG
ncbi:MAG: HAMP domain-containing histidine kinase [Desulfuromonadales bacterium]|nr:HAMP domain-containing histidine kinase [Desulfuromonadales bacterium]